jgi:N-acetylglucosaminyldiphosphoundecaprenol N-acetyl-beta-D-mannosaminyltransferase
MISNGKHNLLGVLIDAVDYEAAEEAIADAARAGRGMAVSALAVHGVMEAVNDGAQRHRMNSFDLVCPDGQWVRIGLNVLHGARLRDRVYGPELTLRLCARAARDGLPIFLYGSKPDVLDALTRNLKEKFPALVIAGAEPSKFRTTTAEEQVEIAARIRDSGARMVFVGLGCPRQEIFAYEYRESIGLPLVAVGAAFDFHAGLLAQAPPRMQRLGLEWLYRLLKEPKRLWRRYVLLNPVYLTLLFLQKARLKRFPTGNTPDPQPVRVG